MRRDVPALSPDETVEVAARRMRDAEVGFLPVVDGEGRPLGTLTDRDIAIRLVAERRSAALPVRALMTHGALTCRPREDARDAERLMAERHQTHVLVTDTKGRLQGVLSLADIAEGRARAAHALHPLAEEGAPASAEEGGPPTVH